MTEENKTPPAAKDSEGAKAMADESVDKEKEIKAQEYLDCWKRAKADLINYKKDEAERAESIIKWGNENILKDMISVMDSFDLSIASLQSSEGNASVLKGVLMVRSQMEHLLSKYSLIPIKAVSEKFNPAEHEILSEIESDKPSGTVLEEIERGWKLYDKILRPSRVKIAK